MGGGGSDGRGGETHLLEISGKSVQILVIGQEGVALGSKKVVVPHPQHTKNHRNLLYRQ